MIKNANDALRMLFLLLTRQLDSGELFAYETIFVTDDANNVYVKEVSGLRLVKPVDWKATELANIFNYFTYGKVMKK
jgi:hypothetical protein